MELMKCSVISLILQFGTTKMKNIIYYKLIPVYEPDENTILSAATVNCIATGKILSGMGGGCLAISPDIIDYMISNKSSKVICKSTQYDELLEMVDDIIFDRIDAAKSKALAIYSTNNKNQV